MAALTANAMWTMRSAKTIAMKIQTGSVVYNTALCSFNTTTGAVKPYDGTGADKLAGWHFSDAKTGNVSASVPPRAEINPGDFIVENLAIPDLGGSDADLGAPVYASDDGTYVLTDPTGTRHVPGVVVRRRDATHADVYFRNVLGLAGTAAAWTY